jgi:spermidine synthase
VLVIGYGMGITASCFRESDISEIQVAEICLPVIEASAKWFSLWNHDIINSPELQIIADDGRSWLQVTGRTYDIITCDANHPRHSTNLFTREFFSLCKSRLSENGVMCHWMPTNWLTQDEYKSVLKAFIDVFGQSSLWYVNRGVTLIIGTTKPARIEAKRLNQLFTNRNIYGDLTETDILNPEMMLARLCMDSVELNHYCEGIRSNTDDYPTVEFGKLVGMAPSVEILNSLYNSGWRFEEAVLFPEWNKQTMIDRISNCTTRIRQGILQDIQSLRNY